ncbi:MAG: HIT domain-containing protein [Actinomycetota bacterium]
MANEHLWAGWRSEYVADAATTDGDDRDGCVLCRVIAPDADEQVDVVHRGERMVCILNRFPYVNGHVMVLPSRHVDRLDLLDDDESAELWSMLETAVAAITTAYEPGGVNVGANLGPAAGAGIPSHLHLHALPRWRGDTNFMTTIANVRVIPEAPEVTAAKLRAAWPESGRPWGGR